LLSHFVSQLRSNEKADREDWHYVETLLLPFARGLSPNWLFALRREAGYALSHIVGSGTQAKNIVGALHRVLMKVRLLRNAICLLCSFL
jgi:hypothetical protein